MCVCVCVRACARVCVCVCVCRPVYFYDFGVESKLSGQFVRLYCRLLNYDFSVARSTFLT